MDKAKTIIATYLKVDPTEINDSTVIDGKAIPGSVLLHRMYSKLSAEGYVLRNPESMKTYGEFVQRVNNPEQVSDLTPPSIAGNVRGNLDQENLAGTNVSIGVDVEDVANMPEADDYRDDRFYSDNFSQKEIAHCILQADPRASFAGKFAAKEALVKTDNLLKDTPFKDIEILNDESGRPVFREFLLSISHSSSHAVAFAVKGFEGGLSRPNAAPNLAEGEALKRIQTSTDKTAKMVESNRKVSYASLFVSIVALFFGMYLLYISKAVLK